MKTIRKSLFLALSLAALSGISGGAYLSAQTAPGEYLTVKAAVMGPGDELYFWWGHIGLIIEDSLSGSSRFYDWGVFSFNSDHFFTNFALGRLIYCCAASSSKANFDYYTAHNRDITVYTLNLSPQKKAEVRRLAENNILPENRDYLYHHFKDNCATRIRDIIDEATGGQFKARYGEAPGRYTYRQHVRRHTWFSPFFDWFLNFLMGQNIDEPTTVWQELFLPAEIGSRIADFTYTDAAGAERPLVTSVEILNKAINRPAILEVPRKQWPRSLTLGTAIAALMAFFMWLRKKKSTAGRVLLGVSQSILGLFFGFAGFLSFFLMTVTNHDYCFNNYNILFVNPLLFAAIPWGIQAARGKNADKRFSPERLLRILWMYVCVAAVLSLGIRLLPWFYQQNQVTVALVLPIAIVLGALPFAATTKKIKKDLRSDNSLGGPRRS
ncbi:MAG: DUF4105 domain-containing protein [Treponema sp.]|jgi:hypothetical protein|nr:DUF4105 domain-containing protein [Treponema sp.]